MSKNEGIALTRLTFVVCLIVVACSQAPERLSAATGGIEANSESELSPKMKWALGVLEENLSSLDEAGLAIARAYIDVLSSEAHGSDRGLISAYDRLYELSNAEWINGGKKVSSLWRAFHMPFENIPRIVALICRDSDVLTAEEKLAALMRQSARSRDSRVNSILVKQLVICLGHEAAISYCQDQVFEGREDFCIPLAEARLNYQREKMKGVALKDEGTCEWLVDLSGEDQVHLLLSEAKAGVSANPRLASEYLNIVYEAAFYLGVHGVAVDFIEYVLASDAAVLCDAEALRRLHAYHLREQSAKR